MAAHIAEIRIVNTTAMDYSLLNTIVTALCSGSLTWIVTLKFTRKEAEAKAMAQIQLVYQSLIGDFQKEREEMKTEISDLKARVVRNETRLRAMAPHICGRAPKCADWIDAEIPDLKLQK